jgi:dienelactone hydrolase
MFADEWAISAVISCVAWAAKRGHAGIGLVGFCYGGGRVVDCLAASPVCTDVGVRAAVTFYATLIDGSRLQAVKQPLLMFFAGQDGLVPPELRARYKAIVDEHRSQGIVGAVVVVDDQPHGFAHQDGVGSNLARSTAHEQAFQFLTTYALS